MKTLNSEELCRLYELLECVYREGKAERNQHVTAYAKKCLDILKLPTEKVSQD